MTTRSQQCTARRSYERATDDGVWPTPSRNRFAWDGCVVIAYVSTRPQATQEQLRVSCTQPVGKQLPS